MHQTGEQEGHFMTLGIFVQSLSYTCVALVTYSVVSWHIIQAVAIVNT